MKEHIILASGSPRRKQLLEWAEVPFDVIVSETDESYPPGLEPNRVALHIALNKARAVAPKAGPDKIVLAADTIVVLDEEIIGKPRDVQDAIDILSRLQGRTHEVMTGVALQKGDVERTFCDITSVEFHPLTGQQIAWYVNKYKPFDKAGAYAIQEWIGVVGIKRIEGDFYNVMGLPVSRVVRELQDMLLQ